MKTCTLQQLIINLDMNSKKATLFQSTITSSNPLSEGLDSLGDSCPASPVIRPMNDFADIPAFDLDDDFYLEMSEEQVIDGIGKLSLSGISIGKMMVQRSFRKDSENGVLD